MYPTSPILDRDSLPMKHLGQGANQAFEDIALLTQLLHKYNPSAGEPSTTTLETIFLEYETARIPRSSLLVKEARKQGDGRVTQGVEACKQRNNIIRAIYKDDESIAANYAKVVKAKEE